jgi:hypothetical protein
MSLWHPTKPAYPIADQIQTLGSPTLRWLEIYSRLPINYYTLGTTILRRDDATAGTTSPTYVKLKEFYVAKLIPKTSKLKIYFELASGVSGVNAYARIYRNGSPYGTERVNNSTTYASYTEDLEFSEGDYIQLYAKCDYEGYALVQNFRIQGSPVNQLFDMFGRIQSRTDEYAGFLFGDGGATLDVNLYRSAADVLKTDDNLDALALRIGGTTVITSGRVLQNIASVAQTLLPDADNTRALGSSSYRWSDVRTALLNGWNPDSHASRHEYGGADLVRNLDYLAIRGTTVIDSSRKLQNIASTKQTLLPDADATYDLGSDTMRWCYIYPYAIRTPQSALVSVAFQSYDGSQYQTAASLVGGRFSISRAGDIYPAVDNTHNLGSSSLRWAYFYAVNKSAAFKHPLHNPECYIVFKCVESPKVTVEDWGIAQLKNGKAFVGLSEEFVALMSDKAEYAVFLTPEGECNGLYVSKKEFYGFEVKELNNGKSNIRFSWQVKAIRIGDEETPVLEEPAPTEPEKREEWEAKRLEAAQKKEEDRLNRMKKKIAKYREVTSKS